MPIKRSCDHLHLAPAAIETNQMELALSAGSGLNQGCVLLHAQVTSNNGVVLDIGNGIARPPNQPGFSVFNFDGDCKWSPCGVMPLAPHVLPVETTFGC